MCFNMAFMNCQHLFTNLDAYAVMEEGGFDILALAETGGRITDTGDGGRKRTASGDHPAKRQRVTRGAAPLTGVDRSAFSCTSVRVGNDRIAVITRGDISLTSLAPRSGWALASLTHTGEGTSMTAGFGHTVFHNADGSNAAHAHRMVREAADSRVDLFMADENRYSTSSRRTVPRGAVEPAELSGVIVDSPTSNYGRGHNLDRMRVRRQSRLRARRVGRLAVPGHTLKAAAGADVARAKAELGADFEDMMLDGKLVGHFASSRRDKKTPDHLGLFAMLSCRRDDPGGSGGAGSSGGPPVSTPISV